MEISEMRALTTEQLLDELEKARREVFNLRFRTVTRQLANTHQLGIARRGVARLLTILRERDLSESPQAVGAVQEA